MKKSPIEYFNSSWGRDVNTWPPKDPKSMDSSVQLICLALIVGHFI